MKFFRSIIIIIAIVALAQTVKAITPNQRPVMFGGGKTSGGGGGGGTCAGVIDASVGCPLPMLGM